MRPKVQLYLVSSGTVNKDESIAIAADCDTVPKCNVHVDNVKVKVHRMIKSATMLGLQNGGIRAKGGWKFTAINPFAVATDLKKMLIVAKLAAAHNTMELFRGPMSFGVGGVCSITWADQRKCHARMVKKMCDLLGCHGGKKPRGGRIGGLSGRRRQRLLGINIQRRGGRRNGRSRSQSKTIDRIHESFEVIGQDGQIDIWRRHLGGVGSKPGRQGRKRNIIIVIILNKRQGNRGRCCI